MSFYEDRLLPWGIDKACGSKGFGRKRARLFSEHPLSGTVLEIGFGSGTNLPYIPTAVDLYIAVDPAVRARKYAAKRLERYPVPLEYAGLDGASLEVPDDSVDFVVSTMSLCTIPDAPKALSEAHRVLKPGGELIFLEHGLSPNPKIANKQHRYNSLQRKLFGGCNLNRPIFDLIEDSGLELLSRTNFQMPGPKALGYMYTGSARK